jgi:hypothetical protein
LLSNLIQNNKNWLKHLIFNFTFVKVIAFSIIYIFGCIFFFIIKFYFLKNYLFIFYSGENDVNNFIFMSDIIAINSYLVTIFYILFTVTVVVLSLMNWRENDFIIEKLQLLETFYGITLFYSIFAKGILYIPILIIKIIDVLSFI